MKTLLSSILLFVLCLGAVAQECPDFRNEYYVRKRNLQESLPIQKGAIVMFGNSITEQGLWSEFFPDHKMQNRGIGGDMVCGMIDRMPYVADAKPSQLFVMAGVNDLIFTSATVAQLEKKYRELLQIVKTHSPNTKIYIQSVLPVNEGMESGSNKFFKDKNTRIAEFNERLKVVAKDLKLPYLDINSKMLKNGEMNGNYTFDGIHLNEKGYAVWITVLREYIC